jgi:tripartite-type tricarboxylate transporter receptor subunit TctC
MLYGRTLTAALLAACVAGGGAALAQSAFAQSYPSKPVRIYTSAPAGPYDIVMRGFAPSLGLALGQAVVIENRTGGNYVPLGEACVRATPDGHTLCTGDIYSISLNAHAFAKAPYQLKDFTPIIHFGYLYAALIVHPSVKANTIQELFALAKAKPEALTFATPGPATNSSMYVDYFKKSMGVAFLNVPYKSFVQSLQAVVAGESHATIFGIGQAMNMAKAGKVRALAITGEQRSQFAPQLPTLVESGVDINISNWGGIMGPAGLPREVVLRMNGELKKLIADPVLKQRFLDGQTFEQTPPSGGTPEQFAAFLKAEDAKFERLVKTLGLRLD